MLQGKRQTDTTNIKQWMCIYIHNNAHRLLFFWAVLLAVAIMIVAVPKSYNIINSETNSVFKTTWQYSVDGTTFRATELPHSIDVKPNNKIILKNKIPNEIVKGATVLIRTSQQYAEMYVDSEEIYNSYNNEKNVTAPTAAYHFVRLPTDSGGKEIALILRSPYENYLGLMNQIYIGSKASNVFFLLHENGMRFVVGFLVSSLGFLLMLLFLFTKGQEDKSPNIYLGGLFLFAGYWVMVESKMMQFIFPYPLALTNSSIFALSLLPVFSGLYYYHSHTKILKKTGAVVIVIVTIASFAFGIATCVNSALPLHILPYYLIFMGLYLIAMFTSIIVESFRAGKLFSTSVCGIIAFGICCLIELITYLTNMKGYNESNFLTIGLLLFCIAMVCDSVQNFTKLYQTAIKVDTLTILAYMDGLTELKNRTAFLENMSNIDMEAETLVSLAMFDLNDLKVVNDTLGHLVGDAFLRHSAKVIKNSLRKEDEMYRIGGDEFVAIIHHDDTLDIDSLATRLEEIMIKENQKPLSYHISIAYGFATFSKDLDKNIFETLSRADEKMYACKRLQKECVNMKADY